MDNWIIDSNDAFKTDSFKNETLKCSFETHKGYDPTFLELFMYNIVSQY